MGIAPSTLCQQRMCPEGCWDFASSRRRFGFLWAGAKFRNTRCNDLVFVRWFWSIRGRCSVQVLKEHLVLQTVPQGGQLFLVLLKRDIFFLFQHSVDTKEKITFDTFQVAGRWVPLCLCHMEKQCTIFLLIQVTTIWLHAQFSVGPCADGWWATRTKLEVKLWGRFW